MNDSKTDTYLAAGRPIRIGLLSDLPDGMRGPSYDVVRLAADEMEATGRLDRPVDIVEHQVTGAPSGYIQDVLDGWNELADQGVLVIIGPNHSDNCMALGPTVLERRVPTISMGATSEPLNDYYFAVQWGSIPEDAYLVSNWLRRQGHLRIAVTSDTAWHSSEYVTHFRHAAARDGLEILAERRISQVVSERQVVDVERAVTFLRELEPDAIAHFGTSASSQAWVRGVHDAGWNVPRIMNGTFYISYFRKSRQLMDGWVGTSLQDEDNPTQAHLLAAHQAAYGRPPVSPESGAIFYDAARAALEGVALAPILTPEGVRAGLEHVKHLPAASGGPRTCISFGPANRLGLKGSDVMVLRRVVGDDVVLEGRFDPA